jgi:hypothetical protein
MPVILVSIALIGVLSVVGLWFSQPGGRGGRAAGRPTTFPTGPDPSLTPDQVVAAVLAGLKNNDPETDEGIRTAYRFASPANHAATGPVERFVAMVKRPPYGALVNHRSARAKPLDLDDARAVSLVRVVGQDGRRLFFAWQLSRQTEGALKDCWMTDGVTVVRPPPGEDDAEERI